MASGTGLLNTRTRSRDADLLAALRLDRAHLPDIGDLPDTLHGFRPEFARRWLTLPYQLQLGRQP